MELEQRNIEKSLYITEAERLGDPPGHLELDGDVKKGTFETYDSDEEEDEDDNDDDKIIEKKYGDAEDFQRPSRLDLIVGFLRCFNFLSCATSVFAVTLSLLYSLDELIQDIKYRLLDTTHGNIKV